MQHINLVLPVLDGKSQEARDFMDELENKRKDAYNRSERRIGITKELWWIASLPSGDHLVAYMETDDFANALGLFSQSRDEFDLWFKDRLNNATGIDLNNPPDIQLPELLSNYSADLMPAGD
jgi:hypothetical protein